MVVLEIKFELKLQGKPEDLFRRFPGPAIRRIRSMLEWMCSPGESVGNVCVKMGDKEEPPRLNGRRI